MTDSSQRWARLLEARATAWVMTLLLAVAVALAVVGPLRSGNWMNHVQDDVFYYLTVAENLVKGHGSSFNGIVSTNGYHPLWLLIITAWLLLFRDPRFVPVFFALSIWLATLVTFGLSLLFLRRRRVYWPFSVALSAYVSIYSEHLFSYCMEVTLTIPLFLALLLLVEQSDWWGVGGVRGFWRGMLVAILASLMILSRLDSGIVVALLMLTAVSQKLIRKHFSKLVAAGVSFGLSPVIVYLMTNKVIFGLWLPVSASAKQLKLESGFTSAAFGSLLSKNPLQLLNLVPILIALIWLPWAWRRIDPWLKVVYTATLLSPFVYLTVLSWTSDWQLWGWYFYMFRPALLAAFGLILSDVKIHAKNVHPLASLLVLAFATQRVVTVRWEVSMPEIVDAALDIRRFSLTHPGIYAMGDRSGAVGYLLPYPVVQLEGLMMNKEYLNLIRQQPPLLEVLQHYKVRYYVGSIKSNLQKPCFRAVEPAQAGEKAPHLIGEFCSTPLAVFTHGREQTLVFAVQAER